jgi:hypothetical protein
MARYYVNKKAHHVVHGSGCEFIPSQENRLYLGDFSNRYDAVRKAKKYYPQSKGCYYCFLEFNKHRLVKKEV